jgi:predicted ester cyclase
MKRLLFAMICCCFIFFISCKHLQAHMDSANSNDGDSTAKNAEQTNHDNTNAIYRGIESGDVSVMDRIVATDAIDHSPSGDIKGLDSIKKQLNDMHNHINNLKFEIISDATNGDYHFTLVKMSGTTKDNWMGMPSGSSLNGTSVSVEKMSNGKVTEHWQFVNEQEMKKMMPPKK